MTPFTPITPDEILNLAKLSAAGHHPPPGHRNFAIQVDLVTHVVHQPTITGREILILAGKQPPERYLLRERFVHQKPRDIGLDDVVDLTAHGVERFTTLPKDQTDGLELRRQVDLAAEDIAALDEFGLPWESLRDPSGDWVLLHDCPTPAGYDQPRISIASRLEPGYPRNQLDMCYVFPAVRLLNGRAIPGTEAQQIIDGRAWQRWSRHYTPANPWRPEIDRIGTHLVLARSWLDRELCR